MGRPGRRLDASSEVVADDDEPDALEAGYSRYDQPYDIRYKDTVGPFDLPRNENHDRPLVGRQRVPLDELDGQQRPDRIDELRHRFACVQGRHELQLGHQLRNVFSQRPDLFAVLPGRRADAVVVRNTPFTTTNHGRRSGHLRSGRVDPGPAHPESGRTLRLLPCVGARSARGAGAWVPFDRNFPGVDNVPKWSDWAVRMAGAYDLFGNGKTALKVAANRYLESMAAGFASEFNPMTSTFSTRGWVDFDATSRFSTRTETFNTTK